MAVDVNQVYEMDATTLIDSLEPLSVGCFVTDPPYGCGTQVSARRLPAERFTEIEGVDTINSEWLPSAYRALVDGGAMYLFAKWVNFHDWLDVVAGAGFTIRNCIVWNKLQHGTGDLTGAYAPQHEFILFAVKGKHKLRGTRPIDVIRYPKVQPNDLVHPYQKPVGLIEKLIRHSTDEGALVVDPFCGSGAVLEAARNLNREFIGGDVSAEYVALARKRLALPFTVSMF